VAVAISTYNRRERLTTLLATLECQTMPKEQFEVVIVDNGSGDGTLDELATLRSRTSLRLNVVRVDVNNGPAHGRNAAWRASRAPVVAFTDDDCTPTPRWLELGLAEIDRGTGIVVGRTSPRPDQLHLLGPFSRTMDTNDERYFATCNVFYRRTDLEAVGGFDEGFTTPAGEDTDLAYRVRRLGRTTAFAPEALVYHDVRPSSVRATLRETLRWGGIVRFIARHPTEARREQLHRRYFWKRSHPYTIAATVGVVFATVFPPAILMALPYLDLRLRIAPRTRHPAKQLALLPATYLVDVAEVYTMLRASLKYRTLVL
jgi:GT2 family glycosyltransferase